MCLMRVSRTRQLNLTSIGLLLDARTATASFVFGLLSQRKKWCQSQCSSHIPAVLLPTTSPGSLSRSNTTAHHRASVIDNRNITARQIMSNERLQYSNNISYRQAYRTISALLTEIDGDEVECFAKFHSFFKRYEEADPNKRHLRRHVLNRDKAGREWPQECLKRVRRPNTTTRCKPVLRSCTIRSKTLQRRKRAKALTLKIEES